MQIEELILVAWWAKVVLWDESNLMVFFRWSKHVDCTYRLMGCLFFWFVFLWRIVSESEYVLLIEIRSLSRCFLNSSAIKRWIIPSRNPSSLFDCPQQCVSLKIFYLLFPETYFEKLTSLSLFIYIFLFIFFLFSFTFHFFTFFLLFIIFILYFIKKENNLCFILFILFLFNHR